MAEGGSQACLGGKVREVEDDRGQEGPGRALLKSAVELFCARLDDGQGKICLQSGHGLGADGDERRGVHLKRLLGRVYEACLGARERKRERGTMNY
jgi:hypothetical protein